MYPTGLCEKCGKPVGHLRATTIVPMGLYADGFRYPLLDPVIYHLSPWFTKATIRCT